MRRGIRAPHRGKGGELHLQGLEAAGHLGGTGGCLIDAERAQPGELVVGLAEFLGEIGEPRLDLGIRRRRRSDPVSQGLKGDFRVRKAIHDLGQVAVACRHADLPGGGVDSAGWTSQQHTHGDTDAETSGGGEAELHQ